MHSNKFYFDKIYKRKNFKFEEDSRLIKDILKLKKSGSVLDLGCGEGGNAFYLAKKGFDVTCVDISKTAIKKIKERAKKEKIKINTKVADLELFKITKKYDIIISTGTFHFLNYQKGIELIKRMKKMTKKQGVNIIISFTEQDPTFNKKRLYFRNNQLKEIYSDWKIIKYLKFKEKDEHMVHSLVKIIALNDY